MVKVVFQGEQTNLHAVWDTAVVEALGGSEEAVATTLASKIKQSDRESWSQGTVETWANEAWMVARRFVYRSFPGSGATDAPLCSESTMYSPTPSGRFGNSKSSHSPPLMRSSPLVTRPRSGEPWRRGVIALRGRAGGTGFKASSVAGSLSQSSDPRKPSQQRCIGPLVIREQ